MSFNELTRQEKEKLYISKMTELQLRWKNPINSSWDYVKEYTDEELNKGIEDTIGQLRFEKGVSFIKKLFLYPIYLFVFLGVVGLLFFGIKQLL